MPERRLGTKTDSLLLFVSLAAIAALLSQNIHADFWNDEIYTLRYFVLVPISQTLTDYHVPNNHVLSNLINNIYLKLLSVDSLRELMDNPHYIRLPQLFFSLVSVAFTYKIGNRFFGRSTAIAAVIILASTIPFYNFSAQVRGYPFSTMLVTWLTYLALRYLHQPRSNLLWKIVILSTLLFYTTPSNLYFLLGLAGFFVIYAVIKRIQLRGVDMQWDYNLSTRQIWAMVISIFIGLGLGLLAYSPVFHDVFFNRYTQSSGYFQISQLKYYLPEITRSFISNRWALVAIAIVGYYLVIRKRKSLLFDISLFVCLIFSPILLVFIRGDLAPMRIFTIYVPLYTLFLAVGISGFTKLFNSRPTTTALYLIGIAVYSFWVFDNERSKILDTLHQDITDGKRRQNMYYQYYAGHYQPRADILNLRDLVEQSGIPVVIAGCEPHGVHNYLEQYEIPYHNLSVLDYVMESSDSALLITNHPFSIDGNRSYEVKILNDQLTYHNILLYTKTLFEQNQTYNTVYRNNFEQLDDGSTKFNLTKMTAHSGDFSEVLDSTVLYSTGYIAIIDSVTLGASVKVQFKGKMKSDCRASLVVEVRRGNENIIWEGERLNSIHRSPSEWHTIFKHVLFNDSVMAGDLIKIFIWNRYMETLWIDDFEVSVSDLVLTEQ